MDQQTITQFQTIECVVSDRMNARSRSSQKDCQQHMVSPKQNVVYVRQPTTNTINTNNQIKTEVMKPATQYQMQHNVKVHEIVKVIDNREEVDYYKSKCFSFEKQINELTIEINRLRQQPMQEKVTYIEDTHKQVELERQLISYQNEVNRLNILIRECNNESESWKTKYTQINQQYTLIHQQFYNQQSQQGEIERVRKMAKENEQYMQNEIQRLNLLVGQSQTQMQQLQQTLVEAKKYETMYHQQQSTQNQLANELERTTSIFRQKTEEYDISKQTYSKDIENLQRRIKDQEIEIKEMRGRETNYTIQIERLSRDMQEMNDRFNQELRNKSEELQRMTQVTQTLQITLQDTSKFQEYEMRSKMQSEELTILNQRIRQRHEEIDKLKLNNTQLQNQLQEYQKYVEYENKYSSLYQEYDRINNSLRLKIEENDHLRSCIAKLQITLNDKGKIEDYENKIALMSQEIERLHQSMKSKSDDIERWRQDSSQLNSELQRMNQQIRMKNDEIDQLRTQTESQQKIALLTTEIERLTQQLRGKNDEIEKVRQTLSHFQYTESQKIQELEQKNLVYSNEIDRMSNLIKIKMNDGDENIRKFKDISQRFIIVCSENERLNSIIYQQKDEIEILHRKSQNIELQERITTITSELDSWKQQFVQLNRDYHKNQEALILAQAELDSHKNKRINSTITTFKSEFQSYDSSENGIKIHDTRKSGPLYQIGTLTSRNI